jgi:thiamine phosphate synthase YjbQ (UPF0047 family)
MTSIEVPYSVAAVLPTLTVMDVTNEVALEVTRSGTAHGIAYISSADSSLVRIQEREAGLFEDVEMLLGRLIPFETGERGRLVQMLLGPRTEQVPVAGGRLCLGEWQRVMVFAFDDASPRDWLVTVLGA